LACHLAVVDAEGLSALTVWSAGKFSGDRVAKALRQMQATERVNHRTLIIPGYVSVISGELEDALGQGWRVLVGPQEVSDIAPFFRDVWGAIRTGQDLCSRVIRIFHQITTLVQLWRELQPIASRGRAARNSSRRLLRACSRQARYEPTSNPGA
jgi:hypothetical protein